MGQGCDGAKLKDETTAATPFEMGWQTGETPLEHP